MTKFLSKKQDRKQKAARARDQVAALADHLQFQKTIVSPSQTAPLSTATPELAEFFSPESASRRLSRSTMEGVLKMKIDGTLLGEEWREFYVVYDPPTTRLETFEPSTGRMAHSFLVERAQTGFGRPRIFDVYFTKGTSRAFCGPSSEDAQAWVNAINAAVEDAKTPVALELSPTRGVDENDRVESPVTNVVAAHTTTGQINLQKQVKQLSIEKAALEAELSRQAHDLEKKKKTEIRQWRKKLEVDYSQQFDEQVQGLIMKHRQELELHQSTGSSSIFQLSKQIRSMEQAHAAEVQNWKKCHAEAVQALMTEREKHASELDDISHELFVLKSEHSKVIGASRTSIMRAVISKIFNRTLAGAVLRWRSLSRNVGRAATEAADSAWIELVDELKRDHAERETDILAKEAQHAAEQREIYTSTLNRLNLELDAARNKTEKVCKSTLNDAEKIWGEKSKEKERALVARFEATMASMRMDHGEAIQVLETRLGMSHQAEMSSNIAEIKQIYERQLLTAENSHAAEKRRIAEEHSNLVSAISFGSNRFGSDLRSEATPPPLLPQTRGDVTENSSSSGETDDIWQDGFQQSPARSFQKIPVINLDDLALPTPRSHIQITPRSQRR